jgi:copper transport protein
MARPAADVVRAVGAVVLGLLILVAGATPAGAHASLVSVDPPDGARLDAGPATVTLTFSEPVSADLGGVRVLGADGDEVHQGAAEVDGTRVTIGVQPDLPDGTYVISYRVISADGHPVRGGSVFGVGEGEVDAGALARVKDAGDDRVWEYVGGVGRGLAYAGVLLAAGAALFVVLVLDRTPAGAEPAAHTSPRAPAAEPAAHTSQRTAAGGIPGAVTAGRAAPGDRASLVRGVRAAAVVGAVASLVALPVQAALGTGQGPGSLFDDGVLSDVASDGVGHALLLCLVGLALLAWGVTRSVPAVAIGALVAAGSFAATGHNRADDTALAATLADIAHLVMAAVWAGGLVALWWTLRRRRLAAAGTTGAAADANASVVERGRRAESARLVVRFSTLATASIVVVGLAGLVLSWTQIRTLDAVTDTSYGLLLLAKLSVVGGIALLGAYNHFRLVPALEAGKTRAALAELGRTLRLEATGFVVVLGLTAVLVVLTPAKASTAGGIVEEVVQLGDAGSIQLVVSPATAGFNQIHLYTYDPTGRPAEIAEGVTLELELGSAGLGPIEREAERAGPAHFQLDGDDLALAGDWEITVRARIDRFTEASGTASVPVAS